MAYIRYYVYKKQISLDGGTTWSDMYPTEIVPSGSPIGAYDTLLECEGSEMYRWVKTDDVSCQEIPSDDEILYGKYYIYKRQVSYDSGSTWTDTSIAVTSGDPITIYDSKMHCELNAIYRWDFSDMCINQDKFNVRVKQFSIDSGTTWTDVSPRKTEYISVETYNATDCGYNSPYNDLIGKCFYNQAICNDDVCNICLNDITNGLVTYSHNNKCGGGSSGSGSFYSMSNIGMAISGYNICAITAYGMGVVKSVGTFSPYSTELNGNDVKQVSAETKVSIGYGITNIPNYSHRFHNLEDLVIPNTVTSIQDGAFSGSTYLKKVTMLGVVPPSIGENTFPYSDIMTIYVPQEAVDEYKSSSGWSRYTDYIVGYGSQKTPPSTYKVKITDVFGDEYYISCDGESALTSGNTNIFVYDGYSGSYAPMMKPKTKITRIDIGDCVTTLGTYSIGYEGENCYYGSSSLDNLTAVTIPNSVTAIDERAFQNCAMVNNIVVPSGVTSIGERAFQNCGRLSNITFNSVTPPTLEDSNIFYGCNSLMHIYVPQASVQSYKTTQYWDTYSDIIQGI